jgi:hypothetical protein
MEMAIHPKQRGTVKVVAITNTETRIAAFHSALTRFYQGNALQYNSNGDHVRITNEWRRVYPINVQQRKPKSDRDHERVILDSWIEADRNYAGSCIENNKMNVILTEEGKAHKYSLTLK